MTEYSTEPRLLDSTEALIAKNNKQLTRKGREVLKTMENDPLMQGHFAINPVLWSVVYGEMNRVLAQLHAGGCSATSAVAPTSDKSTDVKPTVPKPVVKEAEPEPDEEENIFDLFG